MGNLNLPQIAASQAQKHQTSNDADDYLDLALTERVVVSMSGGSVTLTNAEFREAMLFDCTGHSAARELVVPPISRPFIVRNGGTGVITLKCGAGSPLSVAGTVAAGDIAICVCNGSENGLYIAAKSSGAVTNPYDIGGMFAGSPDASEVLLRYPFPRAVTIPAGMANSRGVCVTPATSSATFSIRKNGTQVGTMVFGTGSPNNYASFTMASDTAFAAGDVLTIIAPSSPDATLADLAFAIAGTR